VTATVAPPPPAPDSTASAPARRRAEPPTTPRSAAATGALAAELLLAAVTLTAVASFARLFRDVGAVVPLLVAGAAAHAVAAGARRRGLGLVGTAALAVAALGVEVSLFLYPHTSFYGVPTGATLTAAGNDLDRALALFGEVVAPAPRLRGFLLAASVAIWVAVGLADFAAFRLRAIAEAVLPALALFVFAAILGAGGGGVLVATVLAASIAGFALAQRTRRTAAIDAWVGGRSGPGTSALARVGVGVAAVAALAAAVVVPRLPGGEGAALVDWRGGNGPSSRLTVSPLVDIRSRLVQQSDATVFTVEADRPAYWRLTSLDRFDGEVWSSSESFSKADGALPGTPPDATTRPLEQTFDIAALGTIWAPAALTPVDLRRSSTDLRWNGGLATLIVPSSTRAIDDAAYTVVSEVPDFRPEDLQGRLPDTLGADLAAATELPADLSDRAARDAEQIVQLVGPRPYEQALALQNWFRANFTYDLEGTGAGHSDDAIGDFLDARKGYCEQFAGTFAVMARTLGLPARVAVGFTPGSRDEGGSTYTVRGRNAHAWPEVFIPGAGWVPFEPTPGRGQPGAEAYTGVEPAQDLQDEAGAAPTPSTTSTRPADVVRPDDERGVRTGTTLPLEVTTADPGGGGPATVVGWAVIGIGVFVLADVAALAVLRLWRRRRRGTGSAAGQVRAAWLDAVQAMGRLGMRPRPSETDGEFARRAAPVLGPESPALVSLAALVTRTTWASDEAPSEGPLGDEADHLARQVTRRARSELTWGQRLRSWVDPGLHLRPRSA